MDKLEVLTLLRLQQQDLSKCTIPELIDKYAEAEKEIQSALPKRTRKNIETSNINF